MIVAASTDECWEESGSLCRWVYDQTDQNETLANLSQWFIDWPLRILVVVVLAWILTRLARRWVARLVARIVAPAEPVRERLERIGIDLPDSIGEPVRDPRRQSRAASISVVLTSTVIVTIWTIALITILGIVGIQLGPLLAGAGIAGVALGFGAQSLVKDCIAGLFMLIEDQYGLGDVVDLGEAIGVVEEVSLRTTVLRSLDGTVWHVPNGVVQRVGNLSQLWSVALIDVDVAYDTDLETARELLHGAAAEVCEREEFAEQVLEAPTVLGVERLGADGITLRLTVKVEPGAQWNLQRAMREHVKHVFDRAAIEIPFPQRTVWMKVPPNADATDPS
ncbi:MAG: mechanosensitive ion channel family protein [Ilumatobacter sp.]|uniref:mechanosensitive ion channel family protein n=1 Tax=Ilumatobacter sp. TaxID=1967498 RepID=UPI002618CB8C|nr:mechanosensitive ion channel family protein [Ilumatobacter sp.]MDJ0767493.1 mechanosensitive ion channel family protein [Ilumatobacter sp.]